MRLTTKKLYISLTLLVASVIACGENPTQITHTPITLNEASLSDEVTPAGDRILSIAVNEAADGDYDTAFQLARSAGLQTVSLSIQWDEIETAPGVYAPEPNFLAISNLYYPAQNVALDLMIGPIDTNNLRMPEDLANRSFDDPKVIDRYKQLLDYVFSQLPDTKLNSLAIGNEINAWLGNDTVKWQQYTAFYEAIVDYVNSKWPEVPVGSKVMFNAMVGDLSEEVKALNAKSDVVMVTYYPLNGDFSVQDPEVVHQGFQAVADLYPDRTIYIMEIGYPSSEVNASSEEKQAQFIQQAFQAWDTHVEQIQLLNFVWLTDIPAEQVQEYEGYYGLSDEGFLAYLASLGLRNGEGSGSVKPAFQQLILEAEARGW